MEKEKVLELLQKYDEEVCTVREKAAVEAWYNHYSSTQEASVPEEHMDQEKAVIWSKISETEAARKIWRINYRKYVIAIAAALALIVLGIYFFNYIGHDSRQQNDALVQDVAPGKTGATLTLANGKRIRLTEAANGEIAKEAGISISKTADGQIVYEIKAAGADPGKANTLTTAKGETYILTLPDKSKVWLNAASGLTYSATLIEHGVRRVKLIGEAYFEISKDKAHPFVVQTDKQEVEVLGTHFNVNNYSDELTVKTTLLEGSVRVTGKAEGIEKMLKPNQQAVLDNGKLTINNVDAEEVVAWKNGLFVFEDEPLESVMRKIARWYNVEIEYQGADKTMRIGGGVSRYENVSKVLKQLELTKGVHFKIEGRKIIAMK